MIVFNHIKCFINGHDVSGNESIIEAFNDNNWIKQCNCCRRYIMHGDLGSISISKKEALDFKAKHEQFASDVRKHIEGWRSG